MKKIMHIVEPFASGVLNFLVDITSRQIEEYEIYILYGIRPLTPPNVESLFDKRIHLIKIDDFKDKDPQSLRSLGPFSIKKKESLPACSQIYPGTNSIHMILLPMID